MPKIVKDERKCRNCNLDEVEEETFSFKISTVQWRTSIFIQLHFFFFFFFFFIQLHGTPWC